MTIKVSDYISNICLKNNINTIFTITGGFSMHLTDSFGKNSDFDIYYQHHEQACGYAANGYTKTTNKPSIVCTTAGCAATNTITPCLIAYQDSLPILFLSGQVKSNETIRNLNTNKMKLRHYAGADCDIISMITPITKYAYEITKVEEIQEIFSNAIKHMINDRPGPVWISICLDIQGLIMKDLEIPYIERIFISNNQTNTLKNIENMLLVSNRPLIIAGNGIKLGLCKKKFNDFLNKYKIPVVVTWHGTDLLETDNNLFVGRIGILGDRAGNFALQNCDLLLSFGCRMPQSIVGYRSDWFAREAKIIYIDNDDNELEKTNINYHLKVNMDLNSFFDNFNYELKNYHEWVNKCQHWKNKWLFEMPINVNDDSNGINPYLFLKHFFDIAPGNKNIIVSSGSIVTNVWHMVKIKKGDKFIISSQGDMGFELPASIGSQIAEKGNTVIPIFGEGSFQLNIQELQTIVQYKLPIKILIFNNGSHGATKLTQKSFFKQNFGVNKETGISFPDTGKIANSYGIKYLSVHKNEEIENGINNFLNISGEPVIFEVFCCIQSRFPRLNAVKNNDGTFTNRPFEDMDPFLDRDEFKKEMIVKIV